MDYLNAPWRQKYYGEKRTECPFCARSEGVVWGDTRVSVMMNKYPYSLPHWLIVPHEHVMFASDLAEADWLQICRLARVAEQILRADFGAAGVNVGLNLGAAAGAGIAAHLHLHVLARWAGDTNFITTIGRTRVLGTDVAQILARSRAAFAQRLGDGGFGADGRAAEEGGAGGEGGAGDEGECEAYINRNARARDGEAGQTDGKRNSLGLSAAFSGASQKSALDDLHGLSSGGFCSQPEKSARDTGANLGVGCDGGARRGEGVSGAGDGKAGEGAGK